MAKFIGFTLLGKSIGIFIELLGCLKLLGLLGYKASKAIMIV